MEYAAMLSAPGLVSGMKELLSDEDTAVVKRTIRVFTNVYRHSLQLLSLGQLDDETLTAAWPSVAAVAEELLYMLPMVENEGVTVHTVRFLEAAVVAHLVADQSRCSVLTEAAPKMITRGVEALTKLVTTPYVGGSAYLVAVRALITVACYKHDMWASVTDLIQRQIQAPPPTLFDHNVRSLHKTLQRNLFRLLRRADTPSLRSKLIEMMVTVGVPRRMLSQWAPPQEPRKRPQPTSEDDITGRGTPPEKRPRTDKQTELEIIKMSPPRDPRDPRANPRDPRAQKITKDPRDPRDPRNPRDPRARRTPPIETSSKPQRPVKHSQKPASPPRENRSPISNNTKHLEFLQRVISSRSAAASPEFLSSCSDKERLLYDRLDHPRVVSLVLVCLDPDPDTPPEELLLQLGRGGDVTGVRENLTRLLAPHVQENFINKLEPAPRLSPRPTPSPTPSPPPHRVPSPPSPPSSSRSTPSNSASISLSDIDLRQVDIDLRQADVDLRHLLDPGFHTTGDTDMRGPRPPHTPPLPPLPPPLPTSNPSEPPNDPRDSPTESKLTHLNSRDPRSERKDPRTERVDPRKDRMDSRTSQINTSTRMDPRIAMSQLQGDSNTLDPRITQAFADSRSQQDQMMPNNNFNQGFKGNNQGFNNQNFNNQGINPNFTQGPPPNQNFNGGGNPGFNQSNPQNFNRQGNPNFNQGSNQNFNPPQNFGNMGNQPPPNFMENILANFPPFSNGRQDPRMLNGPPPMCPPMNGNPHNPSFMGPRPPMFNPRAMGPGGPWPPNMAQNRMAGMMMMNGGGMFGPPQAPPMHL